MLAQSERHAEAAELVGSIIDDVSADAGDRCESAEICATAALFADDLDSMGRIVSSWSATLPSHSMMRHLVGVNQLALLTLYRGAPAEARYSYSQLLSDDESAGRYTLGWRDWIIGISYLWEGQVDLAARMLRVGLARAETECGRRSPIAVMLAAALADALWDLNQPGEAAELLANRLDVLERRAPPEAILIGYLSATRLSALGGNEQRAFDLLSHLYALGESRSLPRLCIAALAEQMRLHAVHGRGDACAVVERKLDEVAAGLAGHDWGPLGALVELQSSLARAYAAVGRREWQDALDRLDALVPKATRLQRGREAAQIHLLRALATFRCGQSGQALLDEAVSASRMLGLARVVADTHPDLVNMVSKRDATSPVGPATHDRIAPRIEVARCSLLSPREREVLQLLAGNLSNKQIARAMGVTDETVKWHLKNLFGKLNAGSRTHLLHRARMVGILDPVA
jgi:LuxR family maltose regulon positive regulatory protein